jgi:hypothetical protein
MINIILYAHRLKNRDDHEEHVYVFYIGHKSEVHPS